MIVAFASGALVMGYFVAGLVFLRYWRESRDRLFAWFAAAFALLAVQRVLLLAVDPEYAVVLYAVRAVAFLLIIAAIVDKNRR